MVVVIQKFHGLLHLKSMRVSFFVHHVTSGENTLRIWNYEGIIKSNFSYFFLIIVKCQKCRLISIQSVSFKMEYSLIRGVNLLEIVCTGITKDFQRNPVLPKELLQIFSKMFTKKKNDNSLGSIPKNQAGLMEKWASVKFPKFLVCCSYYYYK